ncbi:unnamed protein product [Timema podura]|uniref:Uncharacterized protein n=1 Tax=Timema podura TaxID=61482 RepID=A0ABN7NWP2_TIMPD|nr:unnamed protein product [Timema podura]
MFNIGGQKGVRIVHQKQQDRSPYGNGHTHSSNIRGLTLHKKGSVRDGGDIHKRSRIQTAYELSQDLLDKQIEMLERKYGGIKARNAALTIQRAFRRYMLLKKFAAITAMAKAEKRLSRRLHSHLEIRESCTDTEIAIKNNFAGLYQELRQDCSSQPLSYGRVLPLRSMSMREREHRHMDTAALPRSQSSRCDVTHASAHLDYYTPTSLVPCPCYTGHQHFWDTNYYMPHDTFSENIEKHRFFIRS